MSVRQAVLEVRRCAGTHFDPAVVEAFVPIAAELADHTRG
jgi:response regulator RpfG family c-di-GMP phosphodiesterase